MRQIRKTTAAAMLAVSIPGALLGGMAANAHADEPAQAHNSAEADMQNASIRFIELLQAIVSAPNPRSEQLIDSIYKGDVVTTRYPLSQEGCKPFNYDFDAGDTVQATRVGKSIILSYASFGFDYIELTIRDQKRLIACGRNPERDVSFSYGSQYGIDTNLVTDWALKNGFIPSDNSSLVKRSGNIMFKLLHIDGAQNKQPSFFTLFIGVV